MSAGKMPSRSQTPTPARLPNSALMSRGMNSKHARPSEISKTTSEVMIYTSQGVFGWNDERPYMNRASNDRILIWPILLAVYWSAAAYQYQPGPGLDPGPILSLYVWLILALVGATACAVWIYERAWLRLLSTVVLPLSFLVYVYAWNSGMLNRDIRDEPLIYDLFEPPGVLPGR